jgi:hypothetical protein
MAKYRDRTGTTQGQLAVLRDVGRDPHGHALWLCRCSCGNEVVKSNNHLRGAKTCSVKCGVAASNKARSVHGRYKSKEWRAWSGAKNRCLNPNNSHYHRYGGRGITMFKEWAHDFDSFFAYIGPAPDGAILGRIDNDRGYEPGNVRWATPKQQSNNRTVTLKTEFRGQERPLAEIARMTGDLYQRVFQRFKRGLRGEDLVRMHKTGRKPRRLTCSTHAQN